MNKVQTHPQIEEIKNIWIKNKESLSTNAIWVRFVKDQYGFTKNDVFIFYQSVKAWDWAETQKMVQGLSHWKLKRIRKQNARMIDVLINRDLKKNLKSGKTSKSSVASINRTIRLFNLIQSINLKENMGRKR